MAYALKEKNGDLLKKPQLSRSLSEISSDEEVQLDQSAAEIINLTFDQFCKTSILNQGEFAKFLKSSFTERKSILEKFYDGMDLEQLNLTLREKIKDKEQVLESFKSKIQGINESLISNDADEKSIKIKENETTRLEKIDKVYSTSDGLIKDVLNQYETILTNRKRIVDFDKNKDQNQTQLNNYNDQLDQTKKENDKQTQYYKENKPIWEKAIQSASELKNLKSQNDYHNQKSEEIQKWISEEQNKLKLLQNKVVASNEQIKLIKTEYQDIEEIELATIIEDHTVLKNEITASENLDLELEELKSQIIIINEKINKDSTTYKENLLKLEQLNINQIQEKLKKNDDLLLELNQLKSNLALALDQEKDINKNIKVLNEKINNQKNNLLDVQKNLKAQNDDLRIQEQAKKFNELSIAINLCKHESKKSNICVICNQSLPDNLEKDVQEDNSELIEKNILKIKNEIEKLVQSDQEIKVVLLGLEKDLIKSNEQINSLSSKLIIEWNKIPKLTINQNILKDSSIKELELKIEQSNNLKATLDQDRELFNKLTTDNGHLSQVLKDLQSQLELLNSKQESSQNKLKKSIGKVMALSHTYQLKSSQNQDKVNELDLILNNVKRLKDLESDLVNLYTNEKNSTQLIDGKSKEVIEHSNKLKEISQNIEKHESFLKENSLLNKDAKAILSENEQKNEELQGKIDQLQIQINKFKIAIAEYKSKKDSATEQIEAGEIMIKSHQEKLSDLLKQQESEFLTVNNFKDYQDIIDKLIHMDSNRNDIENILVSSFQKFQSISKEHHEVVKSSQKDLTKYKTLLQQKQQSLLKIDEIEKDLNQNQSKLTKWVDLSELIGKDEFRNFTLSIIETNLIEQTNKELMTLCQGRYSIMQATKTNRLITEFKIIDHLRDGLMRKISTLSGGETFLVSLAMALALAELTRGQTQLDSLFIDEGFGTLDADTIEEVFELLLQIQNSGKQIGIISHVRELTDRIPVNINLEKKQNGVSDINILYN